MKFYKLQFTLVADRAKKVSKIRNYTKMQALEVMLKRNAAK